MASRSATSARILIGFVALLVVLTIAASLSINLGKFQQRSANPESQATPPGIDRSELESALKRDPSDNALQLMAKATKLADDTKVAIDQVSAQVEPARLSKEPNFGSVSRNELDSFRGDLGTAEANASAFLPRYAAILKTEHEQVEGAAVSLGVPRESADQILKGVTQRHSRMLNAMSLILSARADYYRAYGKYIALLSGELGSFKVVAGQFIFSDQRTVERYNAAAQAMTSAGRRVNELETSMKKQEQALPQEWMPLIGAK
jgi:hypothetical protein